MPKNKIVDGLTTPYFTQHRFRVLNEGQIGEIQALWIDADWSQKRLAARYRVSMTTIRRAIASIPYSQMRPTTSAVQWLERRENKKVPVWATHARIQKKSPPKKPKPKKKARKKKAA